MKRRIFAVTVVGIVFLVFHAFAEQESAIVQFGNYREVEFRMPEICIADEQIQAEADFMLRLYAQEDETGEWIYPELTDDFVRENLGCESAAAYLARLGEVLYEEAYEKEMDIQKSEYIDEVMDISEFRYSESELQTLVSQYSAVYDGYCLQSGLAREEFCLEFFGMNEEQFMDALSEQAKWEISRRLILEEIADREGIAIDDSLYQEKESAFKAKYALDERELNERYSPETLMRIFLEEETWNCIQQFG